MRASRWAVPGTAAALVLVLAASVVAATRMDAVPAAAAAPPPVVEPVAATPTATATPTAAPVVPPPPPPTCRPPQPVQVCLGPPPGPQQDARPARVAAPQDRYALLVGVTRYRAPTTDTVAGAQDALLVRDQLLAAGWRSQNIRVVTDGAATGAAVRDGLAWLAQVSRPGTFGLFHFSGHVKQLGGPVNALWTVDRDWVRPDDVQRLLAPSQGRLWVDIAGCEAGSYLGTASDRVLVSTSSRDVEKSYEQPDWGLSVWVGLLLDQGSRQRQADADGDGRVTIGEALRWSTYYAQVVTWLQTPYGPQTPQVAGDPVRGWTLADPPA